MDKLNKIWEVPSWIPLIFGFVVGALIVVLHLHFQVEQVNESRDFISTPKEINIPSDSVSSTIIKVDKLTYQCLGNIDLRVSEVGIVTFKCRHSDSLTKIYTFNPTELRVEQLVK